MPPARAIATDPLAPEMAGLVQHAKAYERSRSMPPPRAAAPPP